ncbi:MAG: UbiA family prenyltransferase [Candidatus Thermoplasmatota archaeon]|nr:UbiA family prenyltransferase [Candidatus Thermoplasmatota archaeon]
MKNQINNRLKAYIEIVRPFTILAPIIVSICIMIASYKYNQNLTDIVNLFFTIIFPASISLAILNAASNVLNQVTDLKSDKISKPYRPICRGIVSKKEAIIISLILYTTSISLALLINLMFLIFISMITFFTITYSVTPRCKDILFINLLWIGIPRGLLGILASWSVFGNALETLPLTIGLLAMVFLIGGSVTKDITDSEADKKTGTKTLVNTYGLKRAAIIAFPFMFFPFAFIPMLIDYGILAPQFFILTFLAIPSAYIFYLMIKDSKKQRHLENAPSWALMYVTYFFLAFGFSIITIAG